MKYVQRLYALYMYVSIINFARVHAQALEQTSRIDAGRRILSTEEISIEIINVGQATVKQRIKRGQTETRMESQKRNERKIQKTKMHIANT